MYFKQFQNDEGMEPSIFFSCRTNHQVTLYSISIAPGSDCIFTYGRPPNGSSVFGKLFFLHPNPLTSPRCKFLHRNTFLQKLHVLAISYIWSHTGYWSHEMNGLMDCYHPCKTEPACGTLSCRQIARFSRRRPFS